MVTTATLTARFLVPGELEEVRRYWERIGKHPVDCDCDDCKAMVSWFPKLLAAVEAHEAATNERSAPCDHDFKSCDDDSCWCTKCGAREPSFGGGI